MKPGVNREAVFQSHVEFVAFVQDQSDGPRRLGHFVARRRSARDVDLSRLHQQRLALTRPCRLRHRGGDRGARGTHRKARRETLMAKFVAIKRAGFEGLPTILVDTGFVGRVSRRRRANARHDSRMGLAGVILSPINRLAPGGPPAPPDRIRRRGDSRIRRRQSSGRVRERREPQSPDPDDCRSRTART